MKKFVDKLRRPVKTIKALIWQVRYALSSGCIAFGRYLLAPNKPTLFFIALGNWFNPDETKEYHVEISQDRYRR